jgi:hypothetical protein
MMTWLQFIGAKVCVLFPFLQTESVAVYPISKREMTISDTTGKVTEKNRNRQSSKCGSH